MIDYYAYFGFSKNVNELEVGEKLSSFLTRVREKANILNSDEEKKGMLNSALKIVQDVCRIFSTDSEKNTYDDCLRKQMIISFRLYNNKKNVASYEAFCLNAKKSWLRVLTCLIPNLENEKQMLFLEEKESMKEILSFIIGSVDFNNIVRNNEENNCSISLDIVKRSFDIARLRGRLNVKAEDIVSSIVNCKHLDEDRRVKLAVMVFERWYQEVTAKKDEGMCYRKENC